MGVEKARGLTHLAVPMQHTGADEHRFSLFQQQRLIRRAAFHRPFGNIDDLIAAVPVPGDRGIHVPFHGFQQAGVGELVGGKMEKFQVGRIYLKVDALDHLLTPFLCRIICVFL